MRCDITAAKPCVAHLPVRCIGEKRLRAIRELKVRITQRELTEKHLNSAGVPSDNVNIIYHVRGQTGIVRCHGRPIVVRTKKGSLDVIIRADVDVELIVNSH